MLRDRFDCVRVRRLRLRPSRTVVDHSSRRSSTTTIRSSDRVAIASSSAARRFSATTMSLSIFSTFDTFGAG